MEGIIKVKKWPLMVGGMVSWGIPNIYPAPWLATPLSILTAATFGACIIIYFHNQKIIQNTKALRVLGPDGKNWNAHVRLDRISNTNYRCVYQVYFTVSRDEIETVKDGNTITYTGDKVRVQEDGIKQVELYCDWIGKNGEELDSNIWRNKFATTIKRNYKGRISVLCCGYLRQEHI